MRVIPPLVIAMLLYGCTMNKINRTARQPNIVIILADDLGYADVGFHGSDINTPNLDKFASTGVRLENFYSCPMCTPTRAGLMTGRYPIRYGLMRSVIPPYRNAGLDPEEDLLPEMLSRAGYTYRACIGKWHLGHLQTKWHPNNQGFTHFVGCYNGAVDYFTRIREGETDWHRNAQTVHTEGYVTDLITEEAISFISSVPKEEPYFLYIPYTAPHSPFQAKEEDIAKYPQRKGKQQVYAAMVDCMDQGIGRILNAIDQRSDRENTFILFFSDNGGVRNIGNNAPMKGHKLTLNEGGIRVAAAVHWPAGGIAGGKIIRTRMGYLDIFPTLAAIASPKPWTGKPLDGINVLESMRGNDQQIDRMCFSYLDQNHGKREEFAVHDHAWKLLIERDAPDVSSPQPDRMVLYQLDSLHIETDDLRASHPQTYQELLQAIEGFAALKQRDQISRYRVGRSGFIAPKDWVIEE